MDLPLEKLGGLKLITSVSENSVGSPFSEIASRLEDIRGATSGTISRSPGGIEDALRLESLMAVSLGIDRGSTDVIWSKLSLLFRIGDSLEGNCDSGGYGVVPLPVGGHPEGFLLTGFLKDNLIALPGIVTARLVGLGGVGG
jgi:hypothetical protein